MIYISEDNKKDILKHLAETEYSKGARKMIVGYLCAHGFERCKIRFAKRTRGQEAATYLDFIAYVTRPNEPMFTAIDKQIEQFEKFIDDIFMKIEKTPDPTSDPELANGEYEFKVGDWVKYMPTPDDCTNECVEAIAKDNEGRVFLCLSNGEYTRPCLCVKYKVQGEERRELIDKLNEVL